MHVVCSAQRLVIENDGIDFCISTDTCVVPTGVILAVVCYVLP